MLGCVVLVMYSYGVANMGYYYNPEISAKPSRIRKIWAAGSYYPGDLGDPIDLSIGIPYVSPELDNMIEEIINRHSILI